MENCRLPNVAPPGRSSAVTSTSILPPKVIIARAEADKRTARFAPSLPSYRLRANCVLTTLCHVCGGSGSGGSVHGGGITVNSMDAC